MNLLQFLQLSQILFDCNDDFTSSDDESLSNEDVPMENFKIYSNHLFDDEEIISNKIDPHYFNAESNLIESFPNRDTLFNSFPKFDYLKEFSGELIPTSIINEERIKREYEEYISPMEKFLTINSFSHLLENFHANMIIETLPTSPIHELSDDYDSKGDIHFLEELLSNDSIPLPENESSNFDHHNDPLFPCPPPKPSDVEIFFDFEPDSGELILAVINNIDELNEDDCFDPRGGTDIAKVTGKRPKPDKHEHGNGKSADIAKITKTGQKRTRERIEYARARNYLEKSSKVNLGQLTL
nr:hypothetical protein [Tanacetum cinerariifolium]